ncbi:hypothetical protein G4G27_04020 [Sphingomonas sp. So64.6b]|uniref:hypothetical protein n=1 Tax=Sphingomonas sp. So64.6b TaxID=2997354 RepID=UPI0016018D32|nr:hypothetical protein [Sphingomonas sp. So64.6b]QNA83264.1 hypothetical protein G4G27_04020 [Sphingomonas sp. So64.6b]
MFDDTKGFSCNARSGRPEAPLEWRVARFHTALGWLSAMATGWGCVFAAMGGQRRLALMSACAALFIAAMTEWRRRNLRRRKTEFAEAEAAYEKGLRDFRL